MSDPNKNLDEAQTPDGQVSQQDLYTSTDLTALGSYRRRRGGAGRDRLAENLVRRQLKLDGGHDFVRPAFLRADGRDRG